MDPSREMPAPAKATGAAQEGDSSEPVVTQTLALGGPGQKQSKSASGGARRQGSRRRAPEGPGIRVDQSSSSIIWAIPTDWNRLQPEQFRAAMQQYFGVKKSCLAGLEGEPIPQKRTRGRCTVPRSSAMRTVRTYAR